MGDGGGRHSDVIRVDEPFEHFEKMLQAFDLMSLGYPEHGNRAPRQVTSKEIEIMRATNAAGKETGLLPGEGRKKASSS